MGYSYSSVGLIASIFTLSTQRHSRLLVMALSNRTVDFSGQRKAFFNTETNTLTVSDHLKVFHLQHPVESTQDESRKLLNGDEKSASCIAVIASEQTKGRGTQGRQWESGKSTGNLYLTVSIPMEVFKIQLTLLPLQIAVVVAQKSRNLLEACSATGSTGSITVKWPNDVLIDDRKLSGTLIESEITGDGSYFLVGIGVNVAHTPNLSASPGKQVRGAACLQEFCTNPLPPNTALILGTEIATSLVDWALNTEDKFGKEGKVIRDFKDLAEFQKEYEIRGEVVDEEKGGYQGEKVTTLDIQSDGQLLVRGSNGKERLLVANYMF